ncbi:hypothetical protein GCM10010156_55290 [Planobispora rosea]|uniref:Uncharacterized protein n=1 Tax=Planobispora rosea TaxID=35762 RepID=A0A8J3WEX4_PLARO|nr:AAA family ATPase [Planobispora rosea]GGS89817.1 hypothetical protein GCM10010156_55290 [Planobispora rosea]GIH86733.1 hypothetical protein Pro02_51410 [Planobispora rosea]
MSEWEIPSEDLHRETLRELTRIEARRQAQKIDAEKRAKQRPKLMDSILDPQVLDDMPDVEPMIPGVLNQNSFAILTGRDSTYKTFSALDWALHLATGRDWHDKRVGMPEDRPGILYVAAEGAYGIRPRIRAWEHFHGIKLTDAYVKYPEGSFNARKYPGGQPTFHLMTRSVNLFDGPDIDDFVNLIASHSNVGLVILDTLRRCSGGAEQNGSDMGVVIDNITRVREATKGGSVLAIAHTDKGDKDTRGSSLIEDDADIVWHSKVDEKSGWVVLTNRKMKDGPAHEDVKLIPKEVGDSVVMTRPDPFEMPSMPDSDKEVLAVIRLLCEAGERASAARVRRMVAERGREMPESTFYKVIKNLLDNKVIAQEKKGAPYTIPGLTASAEGGDEG